MTKHFSNFFQIKLEGITYDNIRLICFKEYILRVYPPKHFFFLDFISIYLVIFYFSNSSFN
jgi:hypothetical protein